MVRADHGDVQQLLDALSPVPVVRNSAAAADGDAIAAEAQAAAAVDRGRGGGAMLNGPFDRNSGKPGTQRRGARLVRPPDELPQMVKYRHCRTPLLVPPGFDGNLITRSAQPPQWALERTVVHGYNGLGKHNRSPNLFSLPDGVLLDELGGGGLWSGAEADGGGPQLNTPFNQSAALPLALAAGSADDGGAVAQLTLLCTGDRGQLQLWSLSSGDRRSPNPHPKPNPKKATA